VSENSTYYDSGRVKLKIVGRILSGYCNYGQNDIGISLRVDSLRNKEYKMFKNYIQWFLDSKFILDLGLSPLLFIQPIQWLSINH
jgi:hypothetical protein